MSMYTKNAIPNVAKNDIVCYKLVYLIDDEMYTLYHSSHITFGSTIESFRKCRMPYYCSNIKLYQIEGEGVHAYIKSFFVFLLLCLNCSSNNLLTVVRSIIPANEKYWKQSGNYYNIEIAARSMRIVELTTFEKKILKSILFVKGLFTKKSNGHID